MAYIPFGPEIGAFYRITDPTGGNICTFNDPTDANFAGVVTEITGLDSADVRDAGDVLTQSDGGFTAVNFYGRRPITITGTMYGYNTIDQRNAQMAKIRAATNAMRGDGVLSFLGKASNAIWMGTPFRRQQPVRFSGGWSKTFNIAVVSHYTPLVDLTPTLSSSGASVVCENQGDYDYFPPLRIDVTGPTSGTLVITNTTTGGTIRFLPGYTVPTGNTLQIFPQQHNAYDLTAGTWQTGQIDFVNSTWFGLRKGNNTITTSSSTLRVYWNSAWA